MRTAFGLYAPLNAAWLRARGATHILGAEPEASLVALASGDRTEPVLPVGAGLPRLAFRVPDRSGEAPLTSYAALNVAGGRRLAGYTEATRGCLHRCAHCPIVPVYNGQFRIIPPEVVMADVDAQVAAGARHITFGDPDFFNGPTHAMRIVGALHATHPSVSYDVTITLADVTVPVTPVTVNLRKEFVCPLPFQDRNVSRLPLFSLGWFERTNASSVGVNVSVGPAVVTVM